MARSSCLWVLLVVVLAWAVSSDAASGTNCSENASNDLKLLNFARTLENLEATFFLQHQDQFLVETFVAQGYPEDAYYGLAVIGRHEIAHAEFLEAAIIARGGTAVPVCNYSFPNLTTVTEYLRMWQMFESLGVSAYDGGINALSEASLQESAATIATIEARHVAYLNGLLGDAPFTDASDVPRTAYEVALIARQFIAGCSYAWNDTDVLPVIRPNGASWVNNQPSPPLANTTSLARGTYTAEQYANDVRALNYALTLEQLEEAYYATGLAAYNSSSFANAGFNQSVVDNIALIGKHKTAHAVALSSIIAGRGGVAVAPCSYGFGLTSVADFVYTASLLANTGVGAYDGAVNAIADTGLQTVMATIATVEARHAAYLNQVNQALPFSSSFDDPLPPDGVIGAITGAIVSCPGGRNPLDDLPTIAPVAITPCAPAKGTIANATCSLASLSFSGFSLSPAYAADTTSYTCTSRNSPSTTVTATSASAGGALSLNSSTSGVQPLTSGTASPGLDLGGGAVDLRVTVSSPSVVIALGDSLTFGETNLNYVVSNGDRGYPAIVANAIDSLNGDNVGRPSLYNLAIDGETTGSFFSAAGRLSPVTGRNDSVLAEENAWYVNRSAVSQATRLREVVGNVTAGGQVVQAVLITLGVNDFGALVTQPNATSLIMQSLSNYRDNYRAVLRYVRDLLPAADLVLVGYYNPFVAGSSSPAAPLFAAGGGMVNAIIAQLAVEFRGIFVDTYAAFLGHEANWTYIDQQPAGYDLKLTDVSNINSTNITTAAWPGVVSIGNGYPNAAGYAVIGSLVVAQWSKHGVAATAGSCARTYTVTCDAPPSVTASAAPGSRRAPRPSMVDVSVDSGAPAGVHTTQVVTVGAVIVAMIAFVMA